MLRRLFLLGIGPFLSPQRRALFLKALGGGPEVDKYLVNEDRDYIIFGDVRIIVKKAQQS